MARPYRTGEWPDRNTEYLFYQTVVGAWPVCAGRLTAYMEKACREAKAYTTWTAPDAGYENAVRSFVERCLTDRHLMQDVRHYIESLVEPGRINSLAQTLIKLTAPGVPDLYQGTELWSLHLVDPDNRRPVDYEDRRRALAEVKQLSARAIWERADEGLPKMWVTHAALQLRKRHHDDFGARSRYIAVDTQGPLAGHVVAFRRGENVMTIVPRLVIRAGGYWKGTTLAAPEGSWTNVLTGQPISGADVDVSELWHDFPVALLERTGSRGHQ
jgi:(1->4)-alpha-D-glucan 1-alpha-D-glucosylmutase